MDARRDVNTIPANLPVHPEQAQSLAKVLRLLDHAQEHKQVKLSVRLLRCADELDALARTPDTATDLLRAVRTGLQLGEQATKRLQREAAGGLLQRIRHVFTRHRELTDPVALASMLLKQLRQQERAIVSPRHP